MQLFKRVDGDDPDLVFEDPEVTSPGSSITYQVILDNDSPVLVAIDSFSDDIYPFAICDAGGNIVGQTLQADDGDGPNPPNGGNDEKTCTYVETAPASPTTVTDTVTIEFSGSGMAIAVGTATLIVQTGGGAGAAVGGIVQLDVIAGAPESSLPTDETSTGPTYGLLAIAIAAGVLTASAGAWYAGRRWLR